MSVLIKGGRVVTAADDYVADVFVDGERVTLIGESLDLDADRVIDARGKYVLPGCVDPHTHLDMPFGGTVTIDDVESGQTAAAFGGTTCHVDFCIQAKGQTFADALADWHAKAEGKQLIDMGYHIAVTDLSATGALDELADAARPGRHLLQALHGLQGRAAWSTTRRSSARWRWRRGPGALVMVHAENGDAIDVLVKQALAAGHTEPRWHALTRPPETEGEATNRAIQLAHVAGAPLYVVHVSCKESVEPIAARAREGLGRLRRDLHAVLLRRLHVPRAAELRGREVRLHAAAARQGEPGRALGRGAHRRALGDLDRPLRVQLGRAEVARPRRLLEDPERRARAREPAADDPRLRRPRRPDHAEPDGRAARDEPGEALRPLPAEGHARGRLRRRHRRSSTPRSG